jgi:hypothetical protein
VSSINNNKLNESARLFSTYLENIMKADQEDLESLKNSKIKSLNKDLIHEIYYEHYLKQKNAKDSIKTIDLEIADEKLINEEQRQNYLLIILTGVLVIVSGIVWFFFKRNEDKASSLKLQLDSARSSINTHFIKNLIEGPIGASVYRSHDISSIKLIEEMSKFSKKHFDNSQKRNFFI